jgi:hypothetical protein
MPKPVKKKPVRRKSTTPKRPSSDPNKRVHQQMAEHLARVEASNPPWKAVEQPEATPPHGDPFEVQFRARMNWSARTSMRRYTRLSNGFSRKIENHMAAVAINYFAYNFIKIHRSLRVTPAMEAKIASRPFDVSDLVNLLIEGESKQAA